MLDFSILGLFTLGAIFVKKIAFSYGNFLYWCR